MDRLPAESPAAVGAIDGRHSGDLLRLQRLLEHGDGFQLVFALCLSIAYRQRIIDEIAVRHPAATTVDLHEASDPSALLDALRGLAAERQPIHVVDVESWLRRAGAPALQALNYRRESLAAAVRRPLIVWLEPGTIATLAREAPDLWAWRAAVLDFSHLPPQQMAVHQQPIFIGSAERRERERRLAEIAAHLQSVAGPAEPAGPDAELMLEASEIEEELGHPEAAMAHAEAARAIFRRIDDRHGEAWAAGRVADILQACGQLDEALRIRQQEQLPVYERLGDVRSKAVTQGQIADLLQARGQLDEALRIRQQEQLPVYERLSDVRSKAVTQGKIADLLQARGQLDEALRIRQQEQLPVYERLGDVRSKAVTQGQIADLLQARGQLDEALRIRQQEQLPVYERLGDVRSKAVTQGKIADLLQARGQLDEALRIRQQEQLPVYERLGDVRSKSATHFQIATLRLARNEQATQEGLQAIFEDLRQAYEIAVQMRIPDGIAAVGPLFAQILAVGQAFERALGVLAEVDAACAVLGDEGGRQEAAALREHIEAMRGG
jgi:tetratricopeptide (TPR) repeat protein